MDFLPVSIKISDTNILIVGGGKVATHKATILSRYTSEVTVIAPEFTAEILRLPFTFVKKTFEEKDLEGVKVLFVCTGDHVLNKSIKEIASSKHILTSVCDNTPLCDFISPAIARFGDDCTISVGSDAKDVKRSIRIRNRILDLAEQGLLSLD